MAWKKKEEYKEASWNPAIEKLKMICRAWDICSMGRMNKNASLWYDGLIDAYAQINQKLSKDEKDAIKKSLPEISKSITENTRGGRINLTPKLYQTLFDFEIKLREFAEAHGLDIPNAEQGVKVDPTEAF